MDVVTGVLIVLQSIKERTPKKYVFPAQITILRLLKARCEIIISRATLNRHLRDMESSGLIKRYKRHRRVMGIGWVFKSSAYYLKNKTYQMARYLYRFKPLLRLSSRVSSVRHYKEHKSIISPLSSSLAVSQTPELSGRAGWEELRGKIFAT